MFAKESKSGKGGILITLILAIVIAVVAFFACSGSGANFKTDAPDLDTIDGLLSTSLPLPADGSRPDEHEPKKNAYFAFTSMAQADSFVSETTGEAVTNAVITVTQKIKARRVVNNGEVYKESLSHSSFKGVGARTYVNGGNYVVWNADKVSSIDNVSWQKDAKRITKDDFISLFGSVPSAYTAYILKDDTIINSEYLGEEKGIYSFRYDLDTETATTKIALEMRTMAGTKSLPLFEKVSLIVRMDENWRIREITTDCVYQVDMLGGVTCKESVTEVFSEYDSNIQIPNAEFLRSYMDADLVEPLPEELGPTDYLLNGFGEYLTGDKPLCVNITASGNETTPLTVNGKAELLINMDDLSALSVRAHVSSIGYGDIALSDLFIGYQNDTAYVKLGDLKAYGSIEEITAIINRLIPIFSADSVAPVAEETESAAALDIASLLANASVIKGDDGITTVHIPLTLGELTIEANILFNEGESVSLASANVSIGDIAIAITPDDTIALEEIGDDYNNIAPVFDVIKENGDLPLEIALGADLRALVNIHLADMTADINLGDLQAKYANDVVYLQYADAKLKFALNDLQTVIDKLAPILEGKVQLPDVNGLLQSLDVLTLLTQATNNLAIVETDGVLTLSTGLDDMTLAIRMPVTERGYTLGGIDVTAGTLHVGVAPTNEEITSIPTETLAEFDDIVTLLDIIDENNEINLTATVDTLSVDVNINLETLTILAKTELFGNTLFVKYAENKVYLSYLGLNVYADIADIDTVLNKLKPIIGEVDLSALAKFDVQELIDGISVIENETGLNVSATLFGMNANILFDTTDNDLRIANISVALSETVTASVVPSEKADYSAMSDGTYYNIVTLLDIIDDEGYISLTLTLNETTAIRATLDLQNTYLYAGVEGVEIFADLNTGDAYVKYPGIQGKVNFNDISDMLESLKPLIEKLAGNTALDGLDLSGFENFDVASLLETVVVSETDGTLAIGLRISGISVTLHCQTANGDLRFDNAAIAMDGMNVSAVLANEAYTPYFDLKETYIDAKELVDTFSAPLTDVLTSDELTATLGGKIISGATAITVQANVDIAGLTSAPKAKASLTLTIDKTATDGTVKTTTHNVVLYYKDLSFVAEGEQNVYFIYNEGSNADTFEGTFTTAKISETLTILKEIYKNMPELSESLKPILIPDENGYPTMPDTSVDVLSMINLVSLNAGVLSVDLNGQAFFASLPTSMIAHLANENGNLALTIPSLVMDGLTIENLGVTLGKAADGAITDDTFAYTVSTTAKDFSSINELLNTLETTSRYRSFSIEGTVSMKAAGIPINDAITIKAQLEVIDEKTYAVINVKRKNVSLAWDDHDGDATLYFDPVDNMIYTVDNSRTRKLVWFSYKYTTTTTYKKYTVDEFTSDILNNILDLLHLSSTIRKPITDSVNGEPHVSTATIENTLLGYAYNGSDTFTINLDLEPLLGDIQTIDLTIKHDSNMHLSSLVAKAKMVSVIELTLDANLSTHADGAQDLATVLATERNSANYN